MSEQLSVERWPLGDTDERSPMYCLYLDGQRIGDVWEQEGADYLTRLSEQLRTLTEAGDRVLTVARRAWANIEIGWSPVLNDAEMAGGRAAMIAYDAALAAVKEAN